MYVPKVGVTVNVYPQYAIGETCYDIGGTQNEAYTIIATDSACGGTVLTGSANSVEECGNICDSDERCDGFSFGGSCQLNDDCSSDNYGARLERIQKVRAPRVYKCTLEPSWAFGYNYYGELNNNELFP